MKKRQLVQSHTTVIQFFGRAAMAASLLGAGLGTGCGSGVVAVCDGPGCPVDPVVCDEPFAGCGVGGGLGGSAGTGAGGLGGVGGAGGVAGAGGDPGTVVATCTYSGTSSTGGVLGGAVAQGGAGGSSGAGGGGNVGTENCPCSRRPGDHNSFMCPFGTGVFATAAIGPAGGTLELSGTQSTVGATFKLQIPPHALSEMVVLRVTELTVPAPQPFVDGSPVYDIQPAGLTFSIPALVRVPYESDARSSSGGLPSALSMYSSGDCATFHRVSDSYINAGFLQGSMTVTGPVFAGFPRTAAEAAACAAPTSP